MKELVNCLNCQKEFLKSKTEIKKSPRHFCCKRCAAILNNKIFPKRKSKYIKICECGSRKYYSSNKCYKCKSFDAIKKHGQKSIQDFTRKNSHASKFNRIRWHAKRLMEYWKIPKYCKICRFDLIVHACHIKAIKNFDKQTLLNKVNHITNLIYLCPNHHAMLDNNLLPNSVIGNTSHSECDFIGSNPFSAIYKIG